MRFAYRNLNADDIGGTTVADYLVAFEGDLSIRDGDQVVYEEEDFPVVELARGMNRWIKSAARQEFSFESMSLAEEGAVSVAQESDGWVIWSVYTPDVRSSVAPWAVVEAAVEDFVSDVRRELVSMGINAMAVLGD